MLMPKCPRCGSKTESIEPDTIEYGNRHAGQYLRSQALQGHNHPLLKAISVGVMVGRLIYKRVPGGGEKRCRDCGHTFR
jgi:NAD-dependent SIR2 family protein deacetylase